MFLLNLQSEAWSLYTSPLKSLIFSVYGTNYNFMAEQSFCINRISIAVNDRQGEKAPTGR